MEIKNVTTKKIWNYHYDSIEEMNLHIQIMKGFFIESIDKDNLNVSFSQTIDSQNKEDIVYKRKDKEIKASLK